MPADVISWNAGDAAVGRQGLEEPLRCLESVSVFEHSGALRCSWLDGCLRLATEAVEMVSKHCGMVH